MSMDRGRDAAARRLCRSMHPTNYKSVGCSKSQSPTLRRLINDAHLLGYIMSEAQGLHPRQ